MPQQRCVKGISTSDKATHPINDENIWQSHAPKNSSTTKTNYNSLERRRDLPARLNHPKVGQELHNKAHRDKLSPPRRIKKVQSRQSKKAKSLSRIKATKRSIRQSLELVPRSEISNHLVCQLITIFTNRIRNNRKGDTSLSIKKV